MLEEVVVVVGRRLVLMWWNVIDVVNVDVNGALDEGEEEYSAVVVDLEMNMDTCVVVSVFE